MPHLFAHDLDRRLQIVVGRSRVQQIALLLDGRELGIALIGDQVEQRIAHALIGNLQNAFPTSAGRHNRRIR